MFRRPSRLLLPLFLTGIVGIAACAGGDDDDDAATTATFSPTPNLTPLAGSIVEVEPNDDETEAMPLGAADINVHGACVGNDISEYVKFTAGVGAFSASLNFVDYVDAAEPYAIDLDLFLYTSAGVANGDVLDGDDAIPPDDAPAEVAATLTTAGVYFLAIECFAESTFWQLSVNVP